MRRMINSLKILIHSVTSIAVASYTAVGVVLLPPSVGPLSPRLTASEMTLVGAEDFTGSWGSPPNPAYWGYDLGGGGWGNNELQTYTSNRDNVRLSGTGLLVIEARHSGTSYTSARVVTRGKVDFLYGLVEARIKMPEGQGLLPAMWMLGSNITTVGYPACGEIDIVELVNTGTIYHNAIHGPVTSTPNAKWTQGYDGYAGLNLSQDFHTYQVYREPGRVTVGIDGNVVGQYTKSGIPAGATWVFDAPFYLTFNIAVGGDWPGLPAAATPFPARMLVDWVRYWQ
jgi:beta-glucanase (GH16 family)